IVSYPRRRTMHAVLAVHWNEEWLLLDNLTMVMVNSLEATQYRPLIAFDYQAMTTFAAGPSAPQEVPAAIQNISGFPRDLPSRSAPRGPSCPERRRGPAPPHFVPQRSPETLSARERGADALHCLGFVPELFWQ